MRFGPQWALVAVAATQLAPLQTTSKPLESLKKVEEDDDAAGVKSAQPQRLAVFERNRSNVDDWAPHPQNGAPPQRPLWQAYQPPFQQLHKNKKPVHVSIGQETVNGLLSLLALFGLSIFGCIGTIFVISSLTVVESLQTRGNCYLVSFAMSQLLVTLLVIPSSALQIMAGDGLNSRTMCHYQWLTLEFSLIVGQLSFVLIAADNYLGYKCSERVTVLLSSSPSSNDDNCLAEVAQTTKMATHQQTNVTLMSKQSSLARMQVRSTPGELTNIQRGKKSQARAEAARCQQDSNSNNKTGVLSSLIGALSFSLLLGPLFASSSSSKSSSKASEADSSVKLQLKLADSLNKTGGTCKRPSLRLAHEFAIQNKASKLETPGCLSYRNCCGRLRVISVIVLVWIFAFSYAIHQNKQNTFGSDFCLASSSSISSSGAGGVSRMKQQQQQNKTTTNFSPVMREEVSQSSEPITKAAAATTAAMKQQKELDSALRQVQLDVIDRGELISARDPAAAEPDLIKVDEFSSTEMSTGSGKSSLKGGSGLTVFNEQHDAEYPLRLGAPGNPATGSHLAHKDAKTSQAGRLMPSTKATPAARLHYLSRFERLIDERPNQQQSDQSSDVHENEHGAETINGRVASRHNGLRSSHRLATRAPSDSPLPSPAADNESSMLKQSQALLSDSVDDDDEHQEDGRHNGRRADAKLPRPGTTAASSGASDVDSTHARINRSNDSSYHRNTHSTGEPDNYSNIFDTSHGGYDKKSSDSLAPAVARSGRGPFSPGPSFTSDSRGTGHWHRQTRSTSMLPKQQQQLMNNNYTQINGMHQKRNQPAAPGVEQQQHQSGRVLVGPTATWQTSTSTSSSLFWPVIIGAVICPSLASVVLFVRAFVKMKQFRHRLYNPKPLPSALSNGLALASPLLMPNSPIPIISHQSHQHQQVYTFPHKPASYRQIVEAPHHQNVNANAPDSETTCSKSATSSREYLHEPSSGNPQAAAAMCPPLGRPASQPVAAAPVLKVVSLNLPGSASPNRPVASANHSPSAEFSGVDSDTARQQMRQFQSSAEPTWPVSRRRLNQVSSAPVPPQQLHFEGHLSKQQQPQRQQGHQFHYENLNFAAYHRADLMMTQKVPFSAPPYSSNYVPGDFVLASADPLRLAGSGSSRQNQRETENQAVQEQTSENNNGTADSRCLSGDCIIQQHPKSPNRHNNLRRHQQHAHSFHYGTSSAMDRRQQQYERLQVHQSELCHQRRHAPLALDYDANAKIISPLFEHSSPSLCIERHSSLPQQQQHHHSPPGGGQSFYHIPPPTPPPPPPRESTTNEDSSLCHKREAINLLPASNVNQSNSATSLSIALANVIKPALSEASLSAASMTSQPAPRPLRVITRPHQVSSDKNRLKPTKVILCTYSYMTDDQLLKSNIIVFVLNLTLWLPFITLMCSVSKSSSITTSTTTTTPPVSQEIKDSVWWLATLNCCSCSYVYALTNRDFRDAFNKLFYYCCCKSHVTFQNRTPIFRRQLELDSQENLRIHIVPGLNLYANKFSKDTGGSMFHHQNQHHQQHQHPQQHLLAPTADEYQVVADTQTVSLHLTPTSHKVDTSLRARQFQIPAAMASSSSPRANDWIVSELVLVKYPKDDLIGMFFGYYSLLVYEIQAVYITLFLWNRDMLTFYCCFTHLLSEIINYALKHLLKHPRPDHGAPGGGLFEGKYGMPSQHCHCFAYLATMTLLLVFHYYRHQVEGAKKLLTVIVTSIGLLLQVLGRIYLKFHTVQQCLVGVLVGSVSAVMFYTIGLAIVLPRLEQLCNISLLRFFSFRKDLLTSAAAAPHEFHTFQRIRQNTCQAKND